MKFVICMIFFMEVVVLRLAGTFERPELKFRQVH